MSGELTQLVSLAGQQAPRIFLLQPPQCWDHYRCELLGPDLLYMRAEFKFSSVANALLTESSLLAELILKEQTELLPTFYTSEFVLSTPHFLEMMCAF